MRLNPVPPLNPVGEFVPVPTFDEAVKSQLIETLARAPEALRQAVFGLTDEQLDTRYKNWTIRQIAHHLADSHMHSYIRFRWALTEDNPTIKPYAEAEWVLLEDSAHGDVEPSLRILEGAHARWVYLLQTLKPEQFQRTFFHPETNENVDLWTALNYYAWHARHHTGQILLLCNEHGS